MIRRFTGWHMTAILCAFFGTVIAVNMTMATFATSTFGGKVVENSYVASQKYNDWLAEAKAQDALGWSHRIALDGERRVTVALEAGGVPLAGAVATGFARHPVGRAADVPLRFVSGGAGAWVSDAPLPPGRWYVHLAVSRAGRDAKYIEDLR